MTSKGRGSSPFHRQTVASPAPPPGRHFPSRDVPLSLPDRYLLLVGKLLVIQWRFPERLQDRGAPDVTQVLQRPRGGV